MSAHDPGRVVAKGAAPPCLRTEGPLLVVEIDGARVPVRLRGINRSGYQHKPSLASSGVTDDELASWRSDWNVQAVRFSFAMDDAGALKGDLAEVSHVVNETASLGQYLILELHGVYGRWSDVTLPPLEPSLALWTMLAREFGGRSHVVFDPWNEPRLAGAQSGPIESEWSQWQPLAQALVDAIREAGAADTLILIGGVDWSYDLSLLSDSARRIDGRGGPLAYAAHVYPFKGPWLTPWAATPAWALPLISLLWRARWEREWDRAFGSIALELPVVVTEFGAQPEPADAYLQQVDAAHAAWWNKHFLRYLDERELSALAWSAGDLPHLANGTNGAAVVLPDNPPDPSKPTEPFGEMIRAWLLDR